MGFGQSFAYSAFVSDHPLFSWPNCLPHFFAASMPLDFESLLCGLMYCAQWCVDAVSWMVCVDALCRRLCRPRDAPAACCTVRRQAGAPPTSHRRPPPSATTAPLVSMVVDSPVVWLQRGSNYSLVANGYSSMIVDGISCYNNQYVISCYNNQYVISCYNNQYVVCRSVAATMRNRCYHFLRHRCRNGTRQCSMTSRRGTAQPAALSSTRLPSPYDMITNVLLYLVLSSTRLPPTYIGTASQHRRVGTEKFC